MLADIYNTLTEMAEPEIQRFSQKLLPGVEHILGIRLPKLRKFARKVYKQYGTAYLDAALGDEHTETMEEILLQGMVIGNLKAESGGNLTEILRYIAIYLPKITNWSTCDSFCAGLKITREYPREMWEFIRNYFDSERAYDVRFGLVMVINYYMQDEYLDRLFSIFDQVGEAWKYRRDALEEKGEILEDGKEAQDIYYAEMALAWAISICYVNHPDETMAYLEKVQTKAIPDDFTYNKALQKITESHCVSLEEKAVIKQMKRRA